MDEPSVGQVVAAYYKTKKELEDLGKEFDKKAGPLNEVQELRKEYIGKKMAEAGVKNMKTDDGTAFFKKQEWVNVADWEVFLEKEVLTPVAEKIMTHPGIDANELDVTELLGLIKESFPIELLTRAVSKTEVLARMGEERENPPPQGLSYGAKQVVQIQKR